MKNARNTSKGISGAAEKAKCHYNPFKPDSQNAEILAILREWIAGWATGREPGEGFGDYAVRTGIVQPVLDPPRDFWKASAA